MPKLPKFYKDENKEWRWREVDHFNGKITANAGEGYKNRAECEEMYLKVTGKKALQLVKNDLQLLLNTLNTFMEGRNI